MLRVSNPMCLWPHSNGIAASAGALHHMKLVLIFPSLEKALGDLHVVFATTARERTTSTQALSLEMAVHLALQHHREGVKVGFLFGPERAGLTNDALSLCTAAVRIPTALDFSSLNLSQAVLLVTHAFFRAFETSIYNVQAHSKRSHASSFVATQAEIFAFLAHFQTVLSEEGYFAAPERKARMMWTLRNFFERALPTQQELKSLWGALTHLLQKR